MLDFVAIDFETANNRDHESACALGLVDVRNGFIGDVKSWYIRPPDEYFTFSRENRQIHGIGRGDVKNESCFDELWPTIAHYFEGRIVAAHNAAGTEVTILRKLFAHFAIDPPEFRYVCTLAVSKSVWRNELTAFKLPLIAQHLNLEFDHHDPKDDAKVCAKILLTASEKLGKSSLHQLAEQSGVDIVEFSMLNRLDSTSAGHADFKIERSLDECDEVSSPHSSTQRIHGFGKEDIESHCRNDRIWKKGMKLFNDGGVETISRTAVRFTARVKGSGSEPYNVAVDSSLHAQCTCQDWINNVERFCKHTVAVALAWDAEGGPTTFEDQTDESRAELTAHIVNHLSHEKCKEVLLYFAKQFPQRTYDAVNGNFLE